MKLVAYHGKLQIKADILRTLEAHRAADEIVKGVYWENGKGCAVGCTINSSNHAEYETRFGIPEALAQIEDVIFEGLPNDQAVDWPIKFMGAIQPGADLSLVVPQFRHWLLTDASVNPGIDHPLVRDAVAECAAIIERLALGLPLDASAAEKAVRSAESAERSAVSWVRSAQSAQSAEESAVWSAVWSARSAVSAVRSAAESALSAARSAAWSARGAAESAARSPAESAESAESAVWSTAWSAAWSAWGRMALKLLELLAAAPVTTSSQEVYQ